MQEITSKDNAVFKYAAKLKDKRFRADEGQYLAEGERLVLDLIAYGFSGDIAFILVEKPIYDRHSTEFAAVKTYIITEKLAGILADTENGQGIFAAVKKPAPKPPSGKNALLLDRIRDPGNLGTIIRSAAAFGFRDIATDNCADPFSPKTVRAAMGCIPKVNLFEADVGFMKSAGYSVVCADMGGLPAETFCRPEKLCLVIGNEANGISDAIRSKADAIVSISMEGVESLNASVSAAILMYELKKQEK